MSDFRTTRWTRVLAAKGTSEDSKSALSELCETYYGPVHEFIRHTSRDLPKDQARDLTHAFFEQLLKKPGLDSLERGRGKFRSYLLGAVKHFLIDHWDREQAQKRGGGQKAEDLEEVKKLPDELDTSHLVYDRSWALAIIDRSLKALGDEMAEAGKSDHFEALKPWIGGGGVQQTQAEVAAQLELTEGALKVAIHRLRKRFREKVAAEIGQTVDQEAEIAEELRYLVEVLNEA